jgi:hypothetical protein
MGVKPVQCLRIQLNKKNMARTGEEKDELGVKTDEI